MSEFTGFVAKILKKEGVSAKGRPWKAYSVRLEKEDGTEYDQWFSSGFEKPEFNEGDYVKINTSPDAKGYEVIRHSKRVKNAPAKSTSRKGVAVGISQNNSAPAAANGRTSSNTQQSIHYQSSRKDAIEVIQLLLANAALPMTAAKTKAGEAKRYEEIMALVDKLTVRFYNDAETHRILESVADEAAAQDDVGTIPEDADDDEETEESDDEDTDESDDE
jgi:hypothetical protein